MTVMSETNSLFKQLLSEVYARRPHKDNQKVRIDCLKPRSNKNKVECKNCGCTKFYVFNYQNSLFLILSSLYCMIMYSNGSNVKN